MSLCLAASWRKVKKKKSVLEDEEVYFYNERKLLSRKIYFYPDPYLAMDSSQENFSIKERPLTWN